MHIKGNKTLSSRLWLNRQLNDPFVKKAHKEGYRSRAAFKLVEIDDKFHLIKNAKTIVDVGAAPGGWSQLLSQRSSADAKIASIDLLRFDPLEKVEQFLGDFEDEENQRKIIEYLGEKADLIVSDIAPSTIGHAQTDHLRMMNLLYSVYDFVGQVLKPNGAFVAKLFQGGQEKKFLDMLKRDFQKATFFKPKASRSVSVEIYVVAMGFKDATRS